MGGVNDQEKFEAASPNEETTPDVRNLFNIFHFCFSNVRYCIYRESLLFSTKTNSKN